MCLDKIKFRKNYRRKYKSNLPRGHILGRFELPVSAVGRVALGEARRLLPRPPPNRNLNCFGSCFSSELQLAFVFGTLETFRVALEVRSGSKINRKFELVLEF